jgi:pseudouridine synthase
MEERLQNVLSHAGVASRRKSAELIAAGRVTVDGVVVKEPGERVDPATAKISVDGKPLAAAEAKRTVMLYKPVGVLSSTSDPFGGKTVAELVTTPERLVPVGRLDKDSEGMLLMSNDGDLTLRLTHPRYEHEKTYIVRAAGRWSEEKLRVLRGPVKMPDGYVTRPVPVKVLSGPENNVTTLEFRLREGRKRQIRYMCSAAHLVVVSLKRVAVGRLALDPALAPGEWRDLTNVKICGLMMMASYVEDAGQIKKEMLTAADFFDEVKARYFADDDDFCERSWGMSHDYRIAVDCRSTMVRVGTTIFGERVY